MLFSQTRPCSESDAVMQNQFQDESPTIEQAGTPLTAQQAELTNFPKQDVENNSATHTWLASIQQKSRRDKKRFWGLFIFFQSLVLVPISLTSYFPIMRDGHLDLWVLMLLFLPAISMLLLALKVVLTKPGWNAEELVRIGGVEAVGTLLDLLSVPKAPKQLTPLYAALTELLPQMKASDAATLTADQRRMLRLSLQNGSGMTNAPAVHQHYRLAILAAMEQIGDADFIPIVERLANGQARTASQQALKAAAIACLPRLRANFGGLTANKTLLRASSREPSAPDTLLRPVAFVPEANPDQLLHAADTPPPPPTATG
ncbi:MAG: hypothetical protein JWN14_3772 [Chthonomonadales bacterium]|nr:hypothetical protein [Chthonomonadales bacterium]